MNNYELIPSPNENYLCVIVPTSHYQPLNGIEGLVPLLNNTFSKPGYVIFDFILSSGNTKERYANVFFNNEGFVAETFNYIIVEKNDLIRKVVSDFLKGKNFYLTHSVLNSTQQKMIENGYII